MISSLSPSAGGSESRVQRDALGPSDQIQESLESGRRLELK